MVILAEQFYFHGNTVLLYHGQGIGSVYIHMNSIQVKEGDRVKKGQKIGEVGMTGLATGPHLHWGVKLNGNWLDGFTLVEESKKHIASYELEE